MAQCNYLDFLNVFDFNKHHFLIVCCKKNNLYFDDQIKQLIKKQIKITLKTINIETSSLFKELEEKNNIISLFEENTLFCLSYKDDFVFPFLTLEKNLNKIQLRNYFLITITENIAVNNDQCLVINCNFTDEQFTSLIKNLLPQNLILDKKTLTFLIEQRNNYDLYFLNNEFKQLSFLDNSLISEEYLEQKLNFKTYSYNKILKFFIEDYNKNIIKILRFVNFLSTKEINDCLKFFTNCYKAYKILFYCCNKEYTERKLKLYLSLNTKSLIYWKKLSTKYDKTKLFKILLVSFDSAKKFKKNYVKLIEEFKIWFFSVLKILNKT